MEDKLALFFFNFIIPAIVGFSFLYSITTLQGDDKANAIITEYVNDVCANILYNTSVFSKDSKGVRAFNEFLATCNIK